MSASDPKRTFGLHCRMSANGLISDIVAANNSKQNSSTELGSWGVTMNKDQVKAFVDKVYVDMAGAMTVGMAYVGVKTGLFRTMAGKGHLHVDEVVQTSGLHSRYVEEWLKG